MSTVNHRDGRHGYKLGSFGSNCDDERCRAYRRGYVAGRDSVGQIDQGTADRLRHLTSEVERLSVELEQRRRQVAETDIDAGRVPPFWSIGEGDYPAAELLGHHG